MTDLTAAEQFFYDHAGSSYDPRSETPEDGRRRGARRLAAAEARLTAGPYFVDCEPDTEPYDGDVPWDGPLWVATLYDMGNSAGNAYLGGISGIACEAGDPYLRVIAAELADEYIPDAPEPSDDDDVDGCEVPADFPVRPLLTPEEEARATDLATCGSCGRSWDDAVATGWTPAPSGRCPFENFHSDDADADA